MKTETLAGMIACCKFTYEGAITLIENHNRQFDAIINKYKELIEKLKEVLVLDEYDFNALQKYKDKVGKLESELQSLQSGIEPTAVEMVREAFEPIQRREVCNNWIPDKGTSATRCKNCGKDRWQHEL